MRKLVCLAMCFASSASSAGTVGKQLEKEFDYNFASSIVLSDSDVFTVGFSDFDPNEYLNFDDESLGDEESVDLRKKITVMSLPFSVPVRNYRYSPYQTKVNGRGYLLSSEQKVHALDSAMADDLDELILGGYLEMEHEAYLSPSVSLSGAAGTHLMYYQNDYAYRSDALFDYKDQIDGVYVNTNSLAMVGEINATLKYSQNGHFGNWYFWSSPHYFNGVGVNFGNGNNTVNPEGWYWVNGVKVFYRLAIWQNMVQSFYTSFNRVDVGGDIEKPLKTDHYYEVSMGWLMTPPFNIPLVTNVGVGLSLNYGSAFKGGSLVFFFNQM
ncbi:Solitary outer membrane autotransporter beta-barrel domain [Vibrio sp. B1REV9]|uniref:Solitary outer membrane autotransporter beta-barrel domain n=1 Tax=Vibrio sp. B1REV9 TaxID=2751179 RepID=UPI001AFA0993|nr:Solitary outer membrane autotransporter beta-barrel domain [Vibrio sp. B1REV9]CAE6924880.1 Solitary outer membrane autotransporter beta-barrel domain [Vibrio sp. B1REV9]